MIVSTDQPILSEDDLTKNNLIRINLESLFSLPDSWVNQTQSYAYTVSLPLPCAEDVKLCRNNH